MLRLPRLQFGILFAERLGSFWSRIYVLFIASFLIYGGMVHLGNIAGLTGTPWLETPLLWRALDLVLLFFNLLTAWGLWRLVPWSVISLVLGLLTLQWIPYTLFREYFVASSADIATLNSLIITEMVLVGILLGLLWAKK
ncbi:MAG: hypothetical protein AAGG02_06325 [Cyanobacteria bacterium P01_H01_bin.15]